LPESKNSCDVDRQHVLVLPHLELAFLDLLGEAADQGVVLRLVLLAGGQQLRLLLLERVDLPAQVRLLRLQALHLLLEPAALLLQSGDLLILFDLELVVSALADAAGRHESRGDYGACGVQSPSVHFHLLFQKTPLARCKYSTASRE